MNPVESLGQEARACLDAFRREVPSAAAAEKGWHGVCAAIDACDPDDPPVDPATCRRPAALRGAPVRRIALAAGIAVAIAATLLLLLHGVMRGAMALRMGQAERFEAIDQAPPRDGHPSARRSVRPPQQEVAVVASPPAVATSGPEDIAPAPRPSKPPARAMPSAGVPGADAPSPVPATRQSAELAEETRLVGLARRALAHGDPTEALEHLARHAERFPTGAFLEERMAYEAMARCQEGPVDPTRADAFERRWPTSPHNQRVRSACSRPHDSSTESRRVREEGGEASP